MAERYYVPTPKSCFPVHFVPLSLSLAWKGGKQQGICMCSVQDELRSQAAASKHSAVLTGWPMLCHFSFPLGCLYYYLSHENTAQTCFHINILLWK